MTAIDRFRELHREGIFVMPNPFDIGSARILARLGFPALATTSAGFAATLGRDDMSISLDELVPHVRDICNATPLPVNVDSERLYADTPSGVADNLRRLVAAGAAGCSLEDWDPATNQIEPIDTMVARISAAAAAANESGLLLTARCENLLHGITDLDDTMTRLAAYRDAGADVLYTPGLTKPADIVAAVRVGPTGQRADVARRTVGCRAQRTRCAPRVSWWGARARRVWRHDRGCRVDHSHGPDRSGAPPHEREPGRGSIRRLGMMKHHHHPLFEFDSNADAVINPPTRKRGVLGTNRAVVCWFGDTVQSRSAGLDVKHRVRFEHGPHSIVVVEHESGPIALTNAPVGAPGAVSVLEDLIALGATNVIGVGGAGALVPGFDVGHVVVPTATVRDEGTSYHYLAADQPAVPHPSAVDAITTTLKDGGVPFELGTVWTTDAFYRETPTKVARRREQGCVMVDMEASAMFAAAAFRGAIYGQLLYAGDDLSAASWDHRGWQSNTSVRERMLDLALAAAARL